MQGEGENRLLTIPNILTLFRILLVPFFVITFYQYPEKRTISLGVFAVASLTDGIDGFLARRLKQITNVGKLLDPIADKLMILCMLFCLRHVRLLAPGGMDWLNTAILYLILAKELFMIWGGTQMYKRGIVVHSNLIGKSATALFVLAILLVFPGHITDPWHGVKWLQELGQWLTVMATVLSFAALTIYICQSLKTVKTLKQD